MTARGRGRYRRRARPDGTRRRGCRRHGWVNAILSAADGRDWVCPTCGNATLTENAYLALCYQRNATRLRGGA